MFFSLLNAIKQRCMKKCEKCGIEIELEHQCMYSYEFCAAGNKGMLIGLLTTAFFYMQNNKIPKMHFKIQNT